MRANWPNLRPSSDGPAVLGRPLCLELHRPSLREADHEVLRLKDVLPVESSDMVVITKAQEIDAILLSLNGDFSHIVNYPPKNYKGIVALQMHNHAEILPKLIDRLTAYLKVNTTMDHYRGKLLVVEVDRIRIRGIRARVVGHETSKFAKADDEILRGGDGTPVEGGDPARERVDEAVQFGVWKCPVDVPVSFRGVAVEVVRAENDFERPTATDQMCRRSVPPPPGCNPTPTSGWPSRVFSRDAKRMSQARTNSLLTPRTQPRIFAMLTTGDLVRRTNVSSRIGRPEGPTAVMMFPVLPVKSKWAR